MTEKLWKVSMRDEENEIARLLKDNAARRAEVARSREEAAKRFFKVLEQLRGVKSLAEISYTDAAKLASDLYSAAWAAKEPDPPLMREPLFKKGDVVRILSMPGRSKFADIGSLRVVVGVWWLRELSNRWIGKYMYALSRFANGEGEITSQDFAESMLESELEPKQ